LRFSQFFRATQVSSRLIYEWNRVKYAIKREVNNMEALKNNKKSIENARKEIIKRINKLRAEKKKLEKLQEELGKVEDRLDDYWHKTPRHTSIYEADMLLCKGMDKVRACRNWIDDEIDYLMNEEERNNGKLPDMPEVNETVTLEGVC
jgi:chromosome segregation ATPase